MHRVLQREERHDPAALLLFAFAFSTNAGRAEAGGLRLLVRTTEMSPADRRAAFVVACTAWALLLALPGAVARVWMSGSSVAAQIVLLIAWYSYLST